VHQSEDNAAVQTKHDVKLNMGSDQLHAYEMAANDAGSYQKSLSDDNAAIQTSFLDAARVKNVPEEDRKYLADVTLEGIRAEKALISTTPKARDQAKIVAAQQQQEFQMQQGQRIKDMTEEMDEDQTDAQGVQLRFVDAD
jgi:hypothetical protein